MRIIQFLFLQRLMNNINKLMGGVVLHQKYEGIVDLLLNPKFYNYDSIRDWKSCRKIP